MQNIAFRVTEWGFVMFSGGCWIHKKMNGLRSSIELVFSSVTGIQCTLANVLHINKHLSIIHCRLQLSIRNSLHFVRLSWVREHQEWGLFVRRNCSPWILSLQYKTCHTLAAHWDVWPHHRAELPCHLPALLCLPAFCWETPTYGWLFPNPARDPIQVPLKLMSILFSSPSPNFSGSSHSQSVSELSSFCLGNGNKHA